MLPDKVNNAVGGQRPWFHCFSLQLQVSPLLCHQQHLQSKYDACCVGCDRMYMTGSLHVYCAALPQAPNCRWAAVHMVCHPAYSNKPQAASAVSSMAPVTCQKTCLSPLYVQHLYGAGTTTQAEYFSLCYCYKKAVAGTFCAQLKVHV